MRLLNFILDAIAILIVVFAAAWIAIALVALAIFTEFSIIEVILLTLIIIFVLWRLLRDRGNNRYSAR